MVVSSVISKDCSLKFCLNVRPGAKYTAASAELSTQFPRGAMLYPAKEHAQQYTAPTSNMACDLFNDDSLYSGEYRENCVRHGALPRSPTTCGQNSASGILDVVDGFLLNRRLMTRHHAPTRTKLESSVFDQTLHFLPDTLCQSVRSNSHRRKLESPM